MGIFEKFADIFISDLSDLIDETDAPEKTVKQVITDTRREINENTKKYEKAKSVRELARKKYEYALKVSESWKNKAKFALAQSDSELAQKALAKKILADKDAENSRKIYDFIAEQTKEIENRTEKLKDKLEKAKAKQALFETKSKVSDIKKEIVKSVNSVDLSDTMDKFRRMQEDVFNEMAEKDDEKKTDDALNKFESEVSSELEKLMKEINDDIPFDDSDDSDDD